MADSKKIYIFKNLKEISKNYQHWGEYGFECGEFFTNENCMADYDPTRINMVKRTGYTGCDKEKNFDNRSNFEPESCQPNIFINENQEFVTDVQPEFIIEEYLNNWKNLFDSVQTIVGREKKENEKPKVFISCHQHSLQKLFFHLDNNQVTGDGKIFGFRNGTCIKITSNDINIISSIAEDNEKEKYKFLDTGSIKNKLISGSYKLDNNVFKFIEGIYMIRHGQALHNYRDLYKNKKEDPSNLKPYLMRFKMPIYNVYLNSCLTPEGMEQAKNLYTELDNYVKELYKNNNTEIFSPGDILISSPMDRTIQTLVEGVTPPDKFLDLKNKFKNMYNSRFPGAVHLVPDAAATGGNLNVGSRFQIKFTTKHRRLLNLRRSRKSKSKKPISQSKSYQKVSKRKVTHQRKKKSGKKSSQKK